MGNTIRLRKSSKDSVEMINWKHFALGFSKTITIAELKAKIIRASATRNKPRVNNAKAVKRKDASHVSVRNAKQTKKIKKISM